MEKKWWHNKLFYQIYPKSFCDSNGDGIGDIPGIISKLDYIRSLGVDLIWISPVYKSPFQDQGYDISDYYQIDPVFGTMEDMDRLIAEAKKRGMGILMDLVVNHCSDQHAWFQECIKDPTGKYGDYFYLSPPHQTNNIRSYFGGSAWSPLPDNPGYQYLHVFATGQPDLNWENPAVRDDICKMINWWLDKGLAGFRIDAIMNIKKPLPFHDYTPDRADGLRAASHMVEDAEQHNGGVHAFLNELKTRCFEPHNAVTIGEVFDADADKLKIFIGENGHFSSMFDFAETVFGKDPRGWRYAVQHLAPDDYKRTVFASQKAAGDSCFFSNVIENHDEPRGVSHYLSEAASHDPRAKKLLACMYYLLHGLPFIYQGQELGMENMRFSGIGQVNDLHSLDEYRNMRADGLPEDEILSIISAFSRDNGRTPMQWSDAENAGFTTGTPWLVVNPDYRTINAAAQEHDNASVLQFYRALAALRKHPAYEKTLVYGSLTPVLEQINGLMAYTRELPETYSRTVTDGHHVNSLASVKNDAGAAIGPQTPASASHANHSVSTDDTDGTAKHHAASSAAKHPRILVLGNFNDTPLNVPELSALIPADAQVLLNNEPEEGFDGTLKPYQAVVLAC